MMAVMNSTEKFFHELVDALVSNLEKMMELGDQGTKYDSSLVHSLSHYIVEAKKLEIDKSITTFKKSVSARTNVLSYLTNRMKFESVRLIEFELGYFGYEKRELISFFDMVSTRKNRRKMADDEFRKLAEKLDAYKENKGPHTLFYRLMRLMVILAMYRCDDDLAVLSFFVETQFKDYIAAGVQV